MDVLIYGIDFPHKKDEFCDRAIYSFYFLSCFRTDYQTEVEGRLVRGRAGDMLIAEPGQVIYHGPLPGASYGFRNDWLYVRGQDLADLLQKYPLPLNRPFHTEGVIFSSYLERIHRERAFGRVGAEDKCNLIVTDAVIDIYRAYVRGESGSAFDKLEYARGEIMKNYQQSWTLSEMAKLSGYSVSRFSAIYKERYGLSPISDLINTRIDNAKLLLRYGSMSVQDIADAVGFSSIYYFSKHFKQKEGVSPLVFRATADSQ